jgi:hypothetical protein
MNNRILARPVSVEGNQTQNLIGNRAHGGDVLNFLIRNPWILDHSSSNDTI